MSGCRAMKRAGNLLLISLLTALPAPPASRAGDDAGRPGDVFDFYHYPDLSGSSKQESPALILDNDRMTLLMGGGALLEGASTFLVRYNWPFQLGRSSPDYGYGSLGITYFGLRVGDVDARGRNNEDLGTFDQNLSVVSLSYAYQPTRWLGLGAGVTTVIHSLAKLSDDGTELENASATGFGLDLGAKLSLHDDVSMVCSIENLIQPNLRMDRSDETWPTNGSTDFVIDLLDGQLKLAAGATFYDLLTGDHDFQAGKEISIAPRGGISYEPIPGSAIRGAASTDGIGGGVDVRRGLFTLSYSTANRSEFGLVHRATLSMQFGSSRAERFERRRGNRPDDLWERGIRLYKQQKYWDATRVFHELYTGYPDHRRADDALYYTALSQAALEHLPTANQVLQYLVDRFPASQYEASAYLELQRNHFADGNYELVEQVFEKIRADHRTTTAYEGARYYEAQLLHMRQQHAEAAELLVGIAPTSEYHRFSLYLMSQCYFQDGRLSESIATMENLLAQRARSGAEEALIDRARVTLGHLKYGYGDYDEALSHYEKVGSSSPFYTEALLARAWASIKDGKNTGARIAAEELSGKAKSQTQRQEAEFVKAVSLANEGQVEEAISVLEALKGALGGEPMGSGIEERRTALLRELEESSEQLRSASLELATILLTPLQPMGAEALEELKVTMEGILASIHGKENELAALMEARAMEQARQRLILDVSEKLTQLVETAP